MGKRVELTMDEIERLPEGPGLAAALKGMLLAKGLSEDKKYRTFSNFLKGTIVFEEEDV